MSDRRKYTLSRLAFSPKTGAYIIGDSKGELFVMGKVQVDAINVPVVDAYRVNGLTTKVIVPRLDIEAKFGPGEYVLPIYDTVPLRRICLYGIEAIAGFHKPSGTWFINEEWHKRA